MNGLDIAIAQVFRKKGRASMAEKDFVFAVSLDFRWFTPKEAQRLLELGIESGLLAVEGSVVKPTFDYKSLDIPKGYAPTAELLQKSAQPKGLFMRIVEDISRAANLPAKEVISQVNGIQDRMGVDAEAAALVVASNYGINAPEYLDEVEEEIGKRYRK